METPCVVDNICRAPGGAEQVDDDGLARSEPFSSVECIGTAGLSPVIFLTAWRTGARPLRLAFNIKHWLAFNMEDSTYAGGLGAARPQPAERTISRLLHITRSGRTQDPVPYLVAIQVNRPQVRA